MLNKINIFIIATLLIIASCFIYITFRSNSIINTHINTIKSDSINILKYYNNEIKNKELNTKNVSIIFQKLVKENLKIALISSIDINNNLIASSKKNKEITAEIYDKITNDFFLNKFNITSDNKIYTKYYENRKFYIIPFKANKGKLLLTYTHKLSPFLIVRITLELISIVLIIVVLCSNLYIINQKKHRKALITKSTKKIKKNKKTNHSKNTTNISKNHENNQIETKEDLPLKNDININKNNVESNLKVKIKKISEKYETSLITLTIYNQKAFKVQSFYKYNKGKFTKEDSNNNIFESKKEIINELKNGSSILLDKNNRIILPLNVNKNLVGALNLYSNNMFTVSTINEIEKHLIEIANIIESKQNLCNSVT